MVMAIIIDVCMWIYAGYITILLTLFSAYRYFKAECYLEMNVNPTDDIIYSSQMERSFYVIVMLVTYIFIPPLLYFNKCGGTYENLVLCVFFYLNKFFDFLFSILFIWEFFWFIVISTIFVFFLAFLYFILFFPLFIFVFSFFKFFYFFVQLYNRSLLFDLMLKIKFVIHILTMVTCLFIWFYPNFIINYSWFIFFEIFSFTLPVWLDFLPL